MFLPAENIEHLMPCLLSGLTLERKSTPALDVQIVVVTEPRLDVGEFSISRGSTVNQWTMHVCQVTAKKKKISQVPVSVLLARIKIVNPVAKNSPSNVQTVRQIHAFSLP